VSERSSAKKREKSGKGRGKKEGGDLLAGPSADPLIIVGGRRNHVGQPGTGIQGSRERGGQRSAAHLSPSVRGRTGQVPATEPLKIIEKAGQGELLQKRDARACAAGGNAPSERISLIVLRRLVLV